jgi:hypothetical protein
MRQTEWNAWLQRSQVRAESTVMSSWQMAQQANGVRSSSPPLLRDSDRRQDEVGGEALM